MIKKNKGITLISLVITIIILLILAGITIMQISQNSLLSRAQEAKEKERIANLQEQLELAKMEEIAGRDGDTITIDEYIQAIEGKENLNITDINDDDGKQVIIDDNYVFRITEEDGNIKIEYIGTKKSLLPKIEIEEITNTTNSITVKVKTINNKGGKIEYYIKSEDDENYDLKDTKTEETYTYSGLEQNKKYNIKIVAISKNKEKAEALIDRKTGTVETLTTANTTFVYSTDSNTWTNQNVTVTASTTVEGFTLQTSKDGQNWSDSPSQTFSVNGTIYVRLWDGINYGGTASANVTNIDKTNPVITGLESTTCSIKIKAIDNEGGIIGYATSKENTMPESFSSTFIPVQTLDIDKNYHTQDTIYYVWVKDMAGNVSAVQTIRTKKIPALTAQNTTFSFDVPNGVWSREKTVTVNTSVQGYTLVISGGTVTGNQSKFTYNGTVRAKLRDSTYQYGEEIAIDVNYIDISSPWNTLYGYTDGHILVQMTDNAFGTGSGVVGYQITTQNVAPSAYISISPTQDIDITLYGYTYGQTYYLWSIDAVGNVGSTSIIWWK